METATIKQFLEAHKVHVSSEWLEDCIKWCKEEALPPGHTTKDLKEKVFEQWLLLDLRDVEIPCLPLNLSLKQQYLLNGTYFLQIMEIVDISKPKYWQIQKIRNETAKNVESENMNSKRVLLLTLTDGVQEVKAMELKFIKSLNLNINPGTKIKLMGPIKVRCGRLLLEEKNIKIIGGEVDTLLVSNAAENIIASFLNLPLNPNPLKIEDQIGSTSITQNQSIHHMSTNSFENYTINMLDIHNKNKYQRTDSLNTKNTSPKVSDFENEPFLEEERINEEIEMMMNIEREMTTPTISLRQHLQKTPDMFSDVDDINFENIEIPKNVTSTSNKTTNQNTIKENLSNSLEENIDVFEDLAVNIEKNVDILASTSTEINTFPKPVVWSIKKLNENISYITSGKFKIKAKFKCIIEKLTVKDEQFHLVVEVEDTSGSITVKISNEIVISLAGSTPTHLMNLKTLVQENDVQSHSEILKILQALKNNLIKLDNLIEVLVDTKEKYPILIKLL